VQPLILALFLAGCGSSSDVSTPPTPPPAPAPAPPKLQGLWAEMDLPLEGAEVSGTADALSVVYREGTAAERLAAWSAALEGHGWVLDSDVSTPEQATRTYSREGRLLILAVAASDGRVTVTAQDLGAF
jgi:hypothetical protein